MAEDAAAPELNESQPSADDTTPEPDADDGDATTDDAHVAPQRARMSPVLLATIVGLVVVVALSGLGGWLGFRAYQSHQVQQQRRLFLQVGRQGAINLTTIDWQHADTDIQRILDSSTGSFYDQFEQRSRPFAEVVKQVKSKSVGTVTEAGLESEDNNEARVLVAVTVKTSLDGTPQQDPRLWRMRISVQKVGDQAKVSNVAFVP